MDKIYVEEMKKIAQITDPEIAHSMADDLLIKILVTHGFKETADAWQTVSKWYA